MFENFDKSDNGSDWNISLGDPLETKDSGFPQPLPTSDGDNVFRTYGSNIAGEQPSDPNLAHKMQGDDSDSFNNPALNMIKENLIDLIYEDPDCETKNETFKGSEETKICNRFSHTLSVRDNISQRDGGSQGRHSNPQFPARFGNWNQQVPVENNPFSVCEAAENENDAQSKTLFYEQD